MKNTVFAAMLTLALLASPLSWAQNAPPSGGNGSPPPNNMQGPNGGQGGGQGMHENFQERKAEILRRMNEHMAEVQQRIGCVQAATNHEALHACMPERREGGGMHNEGGQPQQGGQR